MVKDTSGNKIAVIGAGHMGTALLEGLLNTKQIPISNFIISNPFNKNLIDITNKYHVKITENNREAAIFADWIFLAIKPTTVKTVIKEINDLIKDKLILSVAAAVSIKLLESYSSKSNLKITRLMPNISIATNRGLIGMFSNKYVKPSLEKRIISVISGLGEIIKVKKEKDLDTITLLSGCGPAIISYFINLISDFGIFNNLSKTYASDIAIKIVESTLNILQKNDISPDQLIKSVATKGGITESIIKRMNKNRMRDKFINSMNEGYLKIKETESMLAKDLL